jgi:hypothetical protein
VELTRQLYVLRQVIGFSPFQGNPEIERLISRYDLELIRLENDSLTAAEVMLNRLIMQAQILKLQAQFRDDPAAIRRVLQEKFGISMWQIWDAVQTTILALPFIADNTVGQIKLLLKKIGQLPIQDLLAPAATEQGLDDWYGLVRSLEMLVNLQEETVLVSPKPVARLGDSNMAEQRRIEVEKAKIEIGRVIDYLRNPSFMAYLDPNNGDRILELMQRKRSLKLTTSTIYAHFLIIFDPWEDTLDAATAKLVAERIEDLTLIARFYWSPFPQGTFKNLLHEWRMALTRLDYNEKSLRRLEV